MAASDDDDDSYVLLEVSSDDDTEDSKDDTLESITRHVRKTGREVDRDPAEPEPEAKVPPVAVAAAAAATADNPLPEAVASLWSVDAGTAAQNQNDQGDGRAGGAGTTAGCG